MKSISTVFIFVFIHVGVKSQHANYSVIDSTYFRAKIIKVNLLSPIVSNFSVAYENVLSPEKSIQIGAFINSFGFGITPEFRYYLSATPAPKGVYIAPFLRYQQIDGSNTTFGGGLVLGKQSLYKNRVSIDAYFGPAYNTFIFEEVLKFGIRAGIMIGLNVKSPPR